MTKSLDSPKAKKNHKIRSLIYRIILITIAGLTLGLSFYSWNARRVVGNQLPMPFGFGTSVVLSGSMEPTLKVNDLIFVTPADDYQVGDIIVYEERGELIIHRIVRINDDQIVTRGDANNSEDNPITPEMIIGKYQFRIPFIGFVFRIVKTLPGTLGVLALIAFLMYRSRRKERRSGEEELKKIEEEIRLLQLQQLESLKQAQSGEDLQEEQPAAQETNAPKTPEASEPAEAKLEEPVEAATAESAEDDSSDAVSAEDITDSEAEDASDESEAEPDKSSEDSSVIKAPEEAQQQEPDTGSVPDSDDSQVCDDAPVAPDSSTDESVDSIKDELSEINDLLENLNQ